MSARTYKTARGRLRPSVPAWQNRQHPRRHAAPEDGTAEAGSAVVRDALGVGVAVGLSGFAFGVTSAGWGLTLLQTCALSLLVFTGASQFALVGALAAGGNPFAAAAGAFFLGTRNAFYGLRLSQLLALPARYDRWPPNGSSTRRPRSRWPRRPGVPRGSGSRSPGQPLRAVEPHHAARRARAPGARRHRGLGAGRGGPAVFLALLAPMVKGTTERAAAGLAVLLVLVLLPMLPAGAPVAGGRPGWRRSPVRLQRGGPDRPCRSGADRTRTEGRRARRTAGEHLDRHRADRGRAATWPSCWDCRCPPGSWNAPWCNGSRRCCPSRCSPPSTAQQTFGDGRHLALDAELAGLAAAAVALVLRAPFWWWSRSAVVVTAGVRALL